MASIEKRLINDEPRYDVRYREPSGRQRRKTFGKKGFAVRFAATIEADMLRGTYIDPDAGRIAFQKYAENWLRNQPLEVTSRETIERRLRLHVYPVLGSKSLRQIDPSAIRDWLHGLSLASSNSQHSVFTNVSTVFSAAVDDGLIPKNPCKARSVRAPRLERRRAVPWDAVRVMAVREALPDRFKIVVDLGVGLGLRQGEIFGLSPTDIDWDHGYVHVRRQVKLLGDNQLVFGPPKNKRSRTIPLPDVLQDLLLAYQDQHPPRFVSLPWRETGGKQVTVPLLLTNSKGSALHRGYFNTCIWRKTLETAGVEASRENGCHALRHHYASVLLDAGANIRAVSEYLGHSDPGFTLRTYTHLMPASNDRTRQAIDDAFKAYVFR